MDDTELIQRAKDGEIFGNGSRQIAALLRRLDKPLTYGSLFSGVGGIDLGFDRAGLECAWQVEIDPFARAVLEKHWPGVPKHDDIRTFQPTAVDVVCGGFPCQDISAAGKRAGIAEGTRSGLWAEYLRVVCEIRPRFIVVENVAAMLSKGIERVLGDLAAIGFDAEWHCIPAYYFGSPQSRDRIFIVAYSGEQRDKGLRWCDTVWWRKRSEEEARQTFWQGCEIDFMQPAIEPCLDGISNGVPSEMDADRLFHLGNAVVPSIAEWIGRRLVLSA